MSVNITTAKDIIHYTEELSDHPINHDEGIQVGTIDTPINHVTVCWMATAEAIKTAGENGSDLLIAHESLYYPYNVLQMENPPDDWEAWHVNCQRSDLIEQYNLTVMRLHGSVDDICILDDFAEQLGLHNLVYNDGLVKIYEIAECDFDDLVAHVKQSLHMTGVRVACPAEMPKQIRRIGLPWGGLGLFVNVSYQQALIEQGCDVFIAGETDNYGFRFAQEVGIPMIETSHELSENRGLRHFMEMLAERFVDIEFMFYENECVWAMR
ncbi:MAG: Nif3-like dinuclear metal center hexameric protein [Chloroflexota bacterium]